MARRFGPVSTSLWASERFLALQDDPARLGFIYLLACPHGNSIGLFRMPLLYYAADRRTDIDSARTQLDDMERCGLIERGQDDELRVVNWFHHDTGANNPSSVSSFCKIFTEAKVLRRSALMQAHIVEMCMASLAKADGWNPETKQIAQMLVDVQNLLSDQFLRDIDGMQSLIQRHPRPQPNTLSHTVWDTVAYRMGAQGVNTLWHTVGGTKTLHKETEMEMEMERDMDMDMETGKGGLGERVGANAPPFPAAKGVRAGRKLPPDIQVTLDSLGKGKV